MTGDDRAVSPVFSYVLTLGITTILIVGLLVAATGYVDDQRRQTTENQLQVIGQQLSADIAAADRLARTDGAEDVAIRRDLPDRIVGSSYSINVKSDGNGPTEYYLELSTARPDVTVTVGIASVTDLVTTGIGGGEVVVRYDAAADELEVANA
ncbi:hypothetical protein KY092_06325 [Natronomonas gomsonensis]|uniref:DUF7266 family protein n=1 Tax=Natronomonas gomsonensis TaxID=1046043 RepID=UPI0020CA2FD5|nr:hypothetical protein [Natronomonas gomsonensis]MCY4730169.1 hypothetical protein [Natronomonas gomsonensis]